MNTRNDLLRRRRNSRGAVASFVMIALLLVALATAAISFDYSHGLLVREQLQNAADAGALAGAQELARVQIADRDKKNAVDYAYSITGTNLADNTAVSNNTPGTIVSVTVNGDTMPRTVTVTATRTTANIFARLIGWDTMPVSATATAHAYRGLKQIKPNQLLNLAVSLDHVPTNGPQKGQALNSLIGENKRFTVVLNPQNSKNAAWLMNWNPNQNPVLTVGVDSLIMNGVNANLVSNNLTVGSTIYMPLMTGGPPYNKSRVMVGVVGFTITKVNFPLSIEGVLKDPLIVKGTPGTPIQSYLDSASQAYLDQNSAWEVQLIN